MLFSQRFGYAVHAMSYVAKKRNGALTTLPELAAWMRTLWPGCSETYLSAVVQRLVGGGLLRSQRGIAGGYALARPAEAISLRDLFELLEGVDVGRCGLSLEEECPLQDNCAIRRKIGRVEEAFLRSLEQITIGQLAKEIVVNRGKVASR
jgi:Rrf2 family protein